MADPFIGEIRIFAFTFAPEEWLTCTGTLVPLGQYQALAAVIGTTYGGDGKTSIGVPNLQGRTVAGFGSGPGLTPRKIGSQFGDAAITLTSAQVPQHDHDVTFKLSKGTAVPGLSAAPATDGTSSIGLAAIPVAGKPAPVVQNSYGAPTADVQLTTNLAPEVVGYAGGAGTGPIPTGANPHENRQPYLSMNFCISTSGYFPVRQ